MKKTSAVALILLGPLLVLPAYAGHLFFTKHTIDSSFGGAQSVYATDVDGDTDVDVLGAANGSDGISWWQNDGSQNFTGYYIGGAADHTTSVYAADVDGDADVDALAAAWGKGVPGGGRIAWWESSLNLNPPPGQPITWTEHIIADVRGGTSVYATDVDDDNDVDVLGTAEYDDLIAWWENNPSGNSPPADPVAWTQHTLDDAFGGAYCVYATDLDGDDDTDVLGAALGATTVAWWEHGDSLLTTEEITWTKHIIEHTFSGFPAWVYATDLDGDEDVDVLAADHGTEAGNAPIIWWENDGSPADGGWTEHSIENDYWVWRGVYATDVDGDGDVDILGAAAEDNVVVWWENDGAPRDGGWVVHVLDSAFSYPLSVYATDLDGDQDTDVLSAALAANTVAWWENVTHVTYQPLTLKNYGP